MGGKRKVQQHSGLAGITTLMRSDALDPNVDLQKTEDKVLNNIIEDGASSDNKSNPSDTSEKSNLDEIYKLAKDLDIKIDGMGPDKVSMASKSRRTIVDKLDVISKDSTAKRSLKSSVDSDSIVSVKKSKQTSRRSRANSSELRSCITRERRSQPSFAPVERSPPPPQHIPVYNKQNYDFPIRQEKRTIALTEEQVKRSHIDGVIGNIRTETRNTFSTDMERTQDMKASKLEQIASIKLALSEEGIDTSMITIPSMSSPIEEIDSTLNLLLLKNNRYRYSSLAEEVISAGAEVLESVFDGNRKIPIVNISPDYSGYSSTVNVKLHRLRFETSQVVGDVIEKHNISPLARIGMKQKTVPKSILPTTFRLCSWENSC